MKNVRNIHVEVVDHLEISDCTGDLALVYQQCSKETAQDLLRFMGGQSIHIPLVRSLSPLVKRVSTDLQARGLTPNEIAVQLGVSVAYIQRLLDNIPYSSTKRPNRPQTALEL